MSRDLTSCWKSSGDFVVSSCKFKGDRGVLTLEEDFVGDNDLARSAGMISITLHHRRATTVFEHQPRSCRRKHTGSSSFPFLTTLQYVFF